jgi:hypothetical protein
LGSRHAAISTSTSTPSSLASQGSKKPADIFLIDITGELLSAENFVEFGQHRKREQDRPTAKRQIKSLARL